MADPHKVSTIYSSFLPNLLPTPSYPSSARLSWSVSYTALLQIELVSGSVAHSTNFPSRQLTVLITRLGSVNQHRPPRTSGFGGYTVGNASTPPNRTRVNTLYRAILCNYCSWSHVIKHPLWVSCASCQNHTYHRS